MSNISLWYLKPDEYLNKFLEQGVRCDGRRPDVCRNFKLEINKLSSDFSGTISIRIGTSSYIACCIPEILSTSFDEESNNTITNNRINVTLELPNICGYSGNINNQLFISNTITECLNDSRVLNKNAFITKCEDKELQWIINIKIICLSYDGNSLDYALIASIASLYHTSLPINLIWDEDLKWFRKSSNVYIKNSENLEKMKDVSSFFLKKIPIFVSFTYLNEKVWVCDPNYVEDSQGETVSFCCVDDQIKTLQTQCISKYSFNQLKRDLDSLINVASKRAEEIRSYLLNFKN